MVHKIQDAQQDHKSAMDMLAKKISQLATSVKPPDRENISQITLRSRRGYESPVMRKDESTPPMISRGDGKLTTDKGDVEIRNTRVEDGLKRLIWRNHYLVWLIY